MLLDANRVVGKGQYVAIVNAEPRAFRLRGRFVMRGGAGMAFSVSHPKLLQAERAPQHRAEPFGESRLVHIELVWIDLTLHDVLTEAIGAGDEHYVAETRFRVERENHAAHRSVGAHHLHHADGQPDLEVVEIVVDAINDGAIGEQRSETEATRLEYVRVAVDV